MRRILRILRALGVALPVLSIAPSVALARPLMETPTPTPAATPATSATPGPAPVVTAVPAASPEATPPFAPDGSTGAVTEPPLPEVVSTAGSATPAALSSGETSAPAPMPFATPGLRRTDYAAGMPDAPASASAIRVGGSFGMHVFGGRGWNHEIAGAPSRRASDFVGGGVMLEGMYDLAPMLAVVATGGGHSGTHSDDIGVPAAHLTTSINVWYLDAALRLQTPPDRFGLWIQAGPGAYLARREITTTVGSDTRAKDWLATGPSGALGGGALWHIAQGIEVFGETRWLWAPGKFGNDPVLDLGGVTFGIGATLRL